LFCCQKQEKQQYLKQQTRVARELKCLQKGRLF
jgi:hypothetical protein